MLEHIADFTAWPILTGILVGYIANRIMSGEGKGCCKGDYAAVWMRQWGEGYPSEAVIFSDIKKNITLERSKIVLSPRFHVKLS